MFFTDYETIIDSINKILNKYDLTRENETAFLKLRKDYNDKVIEKFILNYNIHYINRNYNSCNYIKKNILENSNSEIFVTNY